MVYPWYQTVSTSDLQQGDIFFSFPVFLPKVTPEIIRMLKDGDDVEAPVDTLIADVVVVTQSCDLINDKVDTVILCPIWPIEDIADDLGKNSKERLKRLEDIRQGKEPSSHLLAESGDPAFKSSLVEFKRIYTTPKDVLSSFAADCGDRPRLLPPYREHLSQSFARYFMRVGLPVDIPSFR